MGDLVQRDEGPELPRVERPVPFERRQVRNDEQELPRSRPGHRDVVLPEDPLREHAEHLTHLGAQEQGRELAQEARELRHLRRELVAAAPFDRIGQPAGGRLEQGLEVLDVRVHPARSADGEHLCHVGRCRQPGEPPDLQLGHSHGFLEQTVVALRGLPVGARFDGVRDPDLPGELPVHRAARRRHHPLELPEERGVAERLGIAGGEIEAAHLSLFTRPSYVALPIRWAPCPSLCWFASRPSPSPSRRRSLSSATRAPAGPACSSAPSGTTPTRAT